jgi:hypothetical protein
MPHHSITLGGDTEWLEEVSEEDYLAARWRICLPALRSLAE